MAHPNGTKVASTFVNRLSGGTEDPVGSDTTRDRGGAYTYFASGKVRLLRDRFSYTIFPWRQWGRGGSNFEKPQRISGNELGGEGGALGVFKGEAHF